MAIRSLVNGLIAVALAPECAVCRNPLTDPLRSPVCLECWDAIAEMRPPLCTQCGEPLPSWRVLSLEAGRCPRCRRREPAVSAARAIGAYAGSLRGIVQALKYRGCESTAKRLGAHMRRAGVELIAACDVVVPVPLHPGRQRRRGFNQAELLAGELGPPLLRALVRVKKTTSQTGLPAARRHANVRHAFALRPGTGVEG